MHGASTRLGFWVPVAVALTRIVDKRERQENVFLKEVD